ncbi:hypothetical protein B0T36_15325 [Nocardia donostiensis]|nr:hypothetical protein B0T36_15325 [Nocardia donostiensis]
MLPACDVVARVSSNAMDLPRARRAHAVTEWLTKSHGFGATAPLYGKEPVRFDGHTIGFWNYYSQLAKSPPTSKQLGRLLRSLHDLSPPPELDLPPWTPLESLHTELHVQSVTGVISEGERLWLLRRIDEVRAELRDLDWPLGFGLIHGDAWAGNLLWAHLADPAEAILCDWDWVSVGPREVDLVPTWHASIRYGRDDNWVREFVLEYGYDLTTWSGYQPLLNMRDLVQLSGPLRRAKSSPDHARRLRQRLDDIRAGRRTTPWSQYRPTEIRHVSQPQMRPDSIWNTVAQEYRP